MFFKCMGPAKVIAAAEPDLDALAEVSQEGAVASTDGRLFGLRRELLRERADGRRRAPLRLVVDEDEDVAAAPRRAERDDL